jgi:hypothetical protein
MALDIPTLVIRSQETAENVPSSLSTTTRPAPLSERIRWSGVGTSRMRPLESSIKKGSNGWAYLSSLT